MDKTEINPPETYAEIKSKRMEERNNQMREFFLEKYRKGFRTEVILQEISKMYIISPKSLYRILSIRSLINKAE